MVDKTDAELLREAKDALHLLNIGQSPRVFVDQNGERVEYTSANDGKLRAYIAQIEGRLSATEGRGPLGFIL